MNVEIKRSNRKTVSLEVTRDSRVVVRAPYAMTKEQIDSIVIKKQDWIEKCLKKNDEINKLNTNNNPESSAADRRIAEAERIKKGYQEAQHLARTAVQVIPGKVEHYAKILGVSYGKITIRNQKSCWGSCSSKGNLNFNCTLMLAPEECVDYVVIHELCHRKEMNHSKKFWALVESVMPDYRVHRQWLKENGDILMRQTGH